LGPLSPARAVRASLVASFALGVALASRLAAFVLFFSGTTTFADVFAHGAT
jgi:hypothetical protein